MLQLWETEVGNCAIAALRFYQPAHRIHREPPRKEKPCARSRERFLLSSTNLFLKVFLPTRYGILPSQQQQEKTQGFHIKEGFFVGEK